MSQEGSKRKSSHAELLDKSCVTFHWLTDLGLAGPMISGPLASAELRFTKI